MVQSRRNSLGASGTLALTLAPVVTPAPVVATALVVAAALAGCGTVEPVPMVGTLERHRIEVAAPYAEQIVQMQVREGDLVQLGQVLAELDAATIAAAEAASAAQLRQLQARLAELRNGARPQELTAARAAVDAAGAQRDQASREYQRLADVSARGLAAASQLDQQRELRDRAEAQLKSAQATLEMLEQGTRSEQLAQARAAVRAGESQLAQQSALRQRYRLLAPVAGQVESLPFRQGERPPAGAPIVVLLEAGVPFARVYVPETELARVRVGARVSVAIDGVAGSFAGTVRYLSGEASFTPYYALTQRDRGRLAFLAEIDVADPRAAALPVGLPVTVTIDTSSPR